MSNPNLVNATVVAGKAAYMTATTTPTTLISNSVNSGKVLKVNSIIASNIDGASTANVTVKLYKNQTNLYAIASTIDVAADASLVLVTSETPMYIEENDSIVVSSGSDNLIAVSCSYSELSAEVTFSGLAATADMWLTAYDFSGTPDSTQITSWTNSGTGGSTFNASNSSSDGPLKVTYSGYPALQFNSTTYKKLNLATEIDLVTGSVFFVGHQVSSRMIALGGSLDTSSGNCFYGYSGANNTSVLLRNTFDGGLTLSSLSSVSGLKAFGVVKTSNTALSYYDNSPTQTTSTGISGTYKFKKIGSRDYSNSLDSQPSTGYLTEVLYFNSALSSTDAAIIMSGLKSRYGIA